MRKALLAVVLLCSVVATGPAWSDPERPDPIDPSPYTAPLKEVANAAEAECHAALPADAYEARAACSVVAEAAREARGISRKSTKAAQETAWRAADDPVAFAGSLTTDGGPTAAGVTTSSSQRFWNYAAPTTIGNHNSAGETSIGVDPDTNAAMFLMSTTTARVDWQGTNPVAPAVWTDVSHRLTRITSLDPILFTDPVTGRTFVNQLLGEFAVQTYTDDAGSNWTVTQPTTAAPSFDHQTVGGGPYSASVAPPVRVSDYPHAVYYCAQLAIAQCARSDDGGLTFGPPLLMNTGRCGGLHGQVKVHPITGHVFVPNKSCIDVASGERRQGMMMSEDNGLTWREVTVPGTTPARTDPNLAFDAEGNGYFIASSEVGLGSRRPVVSVSRDGGHTWAPAVDIGGHLGMNNAAFPMAVAGDAGRAAVAWYGTTTAGDDQHAGFAGDWYLYAAFTFDHGQHWETVLVTPGDPVQRGCIWLQGGSNPCRNLLDFQGMTMDTEGRALIGYADGCTGPCATSVGTPEMSRSSWGTIARQVDGKRLRAAYDPA